MCFVPRERMVVEWPSTPKTGSRVGRLSPKLRVQNLSPNKDVWLSTIWFFTQPLTHRQDTCQARLMPIWKEAQLERSKLEKQVFP